MIKYNIPAALISYGYRVNDVFISQSNTSSEVSVPTKQNFAPDYLSVSSIVLTVVALILSIWQLKQASDQTKDLKQQTENLKQIQNGLSTKYLGQFPEYHTEIANLIDRAKSTVVMFYDLPGYGIFSNSSGWLQIDQAIQRKRNENVKFSVNVYATSRRKKILKEQFHHEGEKMQEWKKSLKIKPKVDKFLKDYGAGTDPVDLTHELLNSLLEKVHVEIITTTFRGEKVVEIDEHIPLYFWLIDDKEAIISIPTFSQEKDLESFTSTEYGFFTSDDSLIKAMTEMKNRYIALARP
jgi:hypothetical protein